MDTDDRPARTALDPRLDSPVERPLDPRGDRVHLVLPPSSEFLRTVRLVAADAAMRSGCDLDDVEDFRIAVDELSHLLMTSTDHSVHVTFASFDGQVRARGSARARPGASATLDKVSAMIVRATADEHHIVTEAGEVTFDVVKRARRGADDVASTRLASPS